MFSTIWVKKDNLIRLVDAVSANQEGLICDKPRIVYNDELFLFGFDKYFSIPKGEHLPVCWAVDRRYFYKGDLIATVKSGDIFSKPTFDIDNSKHKTLRKIDINKLNSDKKFNVTLIKNLYIQSFISIYYNSFNPSFRAVNVICKMGNK